MKLYPQDRLFQSQEEPILSWALVVLQGSSVCLPELVVHDFNRVFIHIDLALNIGHCFEVPAILCTVKVDFAPLQLSPVELDGFSGLNHLLFVSLAQYL